MVEIVKNKPPLEVKEKQAKATNPNNSVWVSANAGSGKTYILARRVIRLMLQNTKPSQILCLTFTKAAAAEMSNRVFEILGNWAVMEPEKLDAEIEGVTGARPSEDVKKRARQLFALALDTPGGLKIQTIHAFCDALLHQFPLEANVPAHFDQIDVPEQQALLQEAQRNVILQSLGRGKKANSDVALLAKSYEEIRGFASDDGIDKALSHIINNRDEFSNWAAGDLLGKMDALWQRFELTRTDSAQSVAADLNAQSFFSDELLNEYRIQAEMDGGSNVTKLSGKIAFYLKQDTQLERFFARMKIFFTKEGAGTPTKQFGTKTFTDAFDGLRDKFEQEVVLLATQLEQIKLVQCLHASEALFTIAQAILTEYANLKQRQGKLDFDDLIRKAAILLTRQDISAWVQYKLDRGIDHVLVDEAQDTSPLQWQVINAITEEFFSGETARGIERTLFVVGDEKQSIYSFQGADPVEFKEQFSRLKNSTSNADKHFEAINLGLSFRSTQEVLSAVDQVFSLPENSQGLSMLGDLPPHTAFRKSDLGEVTLWPIVPKPKRPEFDDWRVPPDKPKDDAEIVLANRIANEISSWLEREEKLPGREERIKEGDILILIRKRDLFASAITKALKAKGLATAGADRLKLTEHIVAEDMMALGRFAAMQFDDLSLASILKSPLFAFTEEELFAVSHGRKGKVLFSQLKQFETDDLVLSTKANAAVGILTALQRSAQQVPVFEFYAGLFARYDLRKKYLQRLGSEAEEVIDGFLQSAIKHDQHSASGLTDFIEWLANATPEIKREIDLKTNEIRVITVHSSKGLEAPIVFLVDPCSKAFNTRHLPPIATVKDSKEQASFVWLPKVDSRIEAAQPFIDNYQSASESEYRRLLYVGMTRAADRLIICGYGDENRNHDHWHSMVEKGLSAEPHSTQHRGHFIETGSDEFPVRKWVIENRFHIERPFNEMPKDALLDVVAGDWLSASLPQEKPLPRPLTPSGVLNMLDIAPKREFVAKESIETSGSALQIGNAVHDLLQILPDIEEKNRDAAIETYFASFKSELSEAQKTRITRNIESLLANASMTALVGSNSRAEISLTGSVKLGNRTHMVHGQIDRLVVENSKIIIADYKTNQNPPNNAKAIPAEYLAQLGLYRLLVQDIYLNHEVETKLVWVSSAQIMDVPAALTDAQLAALS